MSPRSARPVATTDRLTVRPWRTDEAPELLDVLGREEVTRWLGPSHRRPLVTPQEAVARIATYAERTLATPLGVWAVVPHDEPPVGTVLLVDVEGSPGDVEVGWYLHPDAQGRGLATEAAAAVLRHGFDNGLPEVLAVTHDDNTASQAVCARLGMTALTPRERWWPGEGAAYRLRRRDWRTALP